MKNKKPWLAALLNIIIPGLGYLYVGKRKVFGCLLVASSISGFIWSPSMNTMKEIVVNPYVIISVMLMMIAFAYDVYTEAKA